MDRELNQSRAFIPTLFFLMAVSLVAIGACRDAAAQSTSDAGTLSAELTEEQKREQIAAERFLQLLVKRPSTGTALDRVFGYHVGRGDLGQVIDDLAQVAEAADDPVVAGNHWMVIGLLQLQRSEDAAAATALSKAEAELPDNPLAAYHHGQALLLVGRTDQAAAAMQRAIERDPPRRDYLTIASQLGRLYQRGGKVEEALRIWNRLEASFPGDEGVRQRVARVLMEEGDYDGALRRYQSLATDARAANDRIVYALRAADIRVRVGQKDAAVEELEELLASLRPGSYLYDEARQRIEAAFIRGGDYAGLASYYEDWLGEHPDDIGAILRLARVLSVQGRGAESMQWFEKAIERAPSDPEPLLALVNAYIAQQKFVEAAEKYEQLIELQPDNPDHLVRLGQTLLEDTTRPEPERRKAAAEVWQRLARQRGDDPAIQSQVADLLRGAEQVEDALAGYRRAIELAPDQTQYKEYLGEYLYRLKREDEAMEVWRSLAAGELRTRENLVRLAEVFHQFDRSDDAVATMAEACELDPTIEQRLRLAEWLRDDGDYEGALRQIESAEESTDTFDDRDRVFAEAVKTYQASGRLEQRIDAMRDRAETSPDDAELQRKLAILYNANRQPAPALLAIEKAVQLTPQSVESLELAARMYETAGRLPLAAEKRQRLAEIDPRFRNGHLQRLATLQMRMGRTDDALATGKQMLAAASGSIAIHQFYADLCSQAGLSDQRLDTLRRCVRLNPRSTEAMQALATQLAEDFKTDQAIELYWRMLDAADEIESRRDFVQQLADLYLRNNRLDQLVTRLEIRGRESADRRETVDLVATAHQQAGDLGLAKETLQGLLRESGRDTLLLQRLVALSEQSGEYEEAVRLQRELVRLAPGRQSDAKLASLLIETGSVVEAQEMWLRLSVASFDPVQVARNIDRLYAAGETATALAIANEVLKKDPQDWQMLTRVMVLQGIEGDWEAAAKSAARLKQLKISDTELPDGGKPYQQTVTLADGRVYRQPPLQMMRYQRLYEVNRVLEPDRYGGSTHSLPKPIDFGHAKIFASVFQFKQMSLGEDSVADRIASLQELAMDEAATEDDMWRWYEALTVAQNLNIGIQSNQYADPASWESLWRMRDFDPEAADMLLSQMLVNRARYATRVGIQIQPMPEEKLNALRRLASERQDDGQPAIGFAVSSWSESYASELRIAGREEEADRYLREYIEESLGRETDAQSLLSLLRQLSAHGTDEQLWSLIERAIEQRDDPLLQKTTRSRLAITLLSSFAAPERLETDKSRGAEDPEFRRRVGDLVRLMVDEDAKRPVRRRTILLSNIGGARSTYRISAGGNYQSVQIEFPPKGLGPDDEFVRALRQAWESLGEHTDELIEHLTLAEQADPRHRLTTLVAQATLRQWQERNGEAIERMDRAIELSVELVPLSEPELRLIAADLLLRVDRKRDALSSIESVAVYDQNTMAIREYAAARLAVAIGDADRARQAARRLFGVRLDADSQIELAKMMRQLDMRKLASDLVRRLRSRSGSSTPQLQTLMTYYAAQGDNDQAAAVAMDLLRRSAPVARRNNYINSTIAQRQNALRTLASTGRLSDLIEKTKQRLDNAPKSQRIRLELAEMYAAAGQRTLADQVMGTTDLKDVNNTAALDATAKQLVSAGKMDQACDAYLKLIRRRPQVVDREFYEIKRPFDQQKRLGDLADLFIEMGIEKFSGRAGEVCQDLIRRERNIEKAQELYAEILDAPADSRATYNLSRVLSSSRELLTDDAVILKTIERLLEHSLVGVPWQSSFNGYSTSSEGRHNNGTTYLVRHIADRPESLEALEQGIRKRLEKQSTWLEGKVLLGLVLAERKEFEEAERSLECLLDAKTNPAPTHDVYWLVGSLIDEHAPLHPLADRLYSHAMEHSTEQNINREFRYSLHGRYARFLADTDRRAEARDLVMNVLSKKPASDRQNFGNEEYQAYQKIRETVGLVEFLADIKFPAEALRVARALDPALFEKSGRYQNNMREQLATQQKRLLEQVRKQGGQAAMTAMIDPGSGDAGAIKFEIDYGSQPFTEPAIRSLFVELADSVSETDALKELTAEIQELSGQRPDDDSVTAAYAIMRAIQGDIDDLRDTLGRWFAEDVDETGAVKNPRLRQRLALLMLLRLDLAPSTTAEDRAWIDESLPRLSEQFGPIDQVRALAALGQQALRRDDKDSGRETLARGAGGSVNSMVAARSFRGGGEGRDVGLVGRRVRRGDRRADIGFVDNRFGRGPRSRPEVSVNCWAAEIVRRASSWARRTNGLIRSRSDSPRRSCVWTTCGGNRE